MHLQVPGTRDVRAERSVGPYASPGEASDDYMGVEGKDYRWKHIITVFDSQGNVKEAVDAVGFAVQAGQPERCPQGAFTRF